MLQKFKSAEDSGPKFSIFKCLITVDKFTDSNVRYFFVSQNNLTFFNPYTTRYIQHSIREPSGILQSVVLTNSFILLLHFLPNFSVDLHPILLLPRRGNSVTAKELRSIEEQDN